MFGTTSAMPRWTIATRCVRCAANAGRDWPSGPPCGYSTAGTGPRAARPVDETRDVAVGPRDPQQLRLDELGGGHAERRCERDASLAGRDVERPHLPRLGRGDPRERCTRSVGAHHQVLADAAELALP